MTTPVPAAPVPATDINFSQPVSEEVFSRVWKDPTGLMGLLRGVQNQPIGIRLIALSFFFFFVGGIQALIMRAQLAVPNNTLLDPETYNRIMTMHGTTMMFLVAIPMIEGISTLVLPQMLGARELPYPRLAAFSFWTFLFGGLIFYAGFLIDAVPNGGWFAYVPMTGKEYSPGLGIDFWLLGLNVAEIAAIAGAFENIIAFFKFRAVGMAIHRIPIFAWALVVTAWMIIFAFTPLVVASTLLELDRAIGTQFFNPDQNGDPLLWQHIFWIFGHPDVYIIFLPPLGTVATIVTVFARRALIGYTFIVISLVATGFLSFGLWVHHMFATGLPELALAFFTAASMMIAIPSGVQVFASIATIASGRPVFKTPFLFVLGFLMIFVLGGLSGVMLAAVPVNLQAHDSYFVVAHFHYVLIGGWLFPTLAAIYYWFPKFAEKMTSERLGQLNFWLLFIGFNLAFFPMHMSGILGMPRRVYTYNAGQGLEVYNMISSIGSAIVGLSFLVFLYNMIQSARKGPPAPANPWNSDTLEWATPTPAPDYGFRWLPVVRSRHAVWEPARLEEAKPSTQKLLETLAHYPRNYRAQLVTSTVTAEPEEVFRVAGPSIFPLCASLSVAIWTVLLVFSQYALSFVALAAVGLSLVGWYWDNGKYSNAAEEEAFEREFGVPLRPQGSRAVSRWGMALTIVTLATALATLIFSYLYLRLKPAQWPPEGITAPDPIVPGVALLVLIVGAVAMRWAVRGVHQNRATPLQGGLLIAVLCGLGYMALNFASYGSLGFNYQTQAFGSIFAVLAAYQLFVSGAGILMSAASLFWFVRGGRSRDTQPRRHLAVTDIAMFWGYMAAAGAITYALLYLGPLVI